jgi:hypothetical protein
LDNEYKKLTDLRQEAYMANVKNIVELEKKIVNRLGTLVGLDIPEEIKTQVLNLSRASQSMHQGLYHYYHQSYKKPELVMETQSSFSLCLEAMGEIVHFGCKGAKDRTGNFSNYLQSKLTYAESHSGNLPTVLEGMEWRQSHAQEIHDFSASQDGAKFNLGMPGLQIDDEVTLGVDASLGKRHAESVKSTYSNAAKIPGKISLP